MAFHEYPYTDFHEMNLDWVIKKVKELADAWVQVQSDWQDEQAAFQTLKSWVENYFNNLDVQQEINVKLDALVLNGTMSNLIAPYVTSGLPAVVAAQLSDVVSAQIGAVVAAQIGAVVADQLPAIAASAAAAEVSSWLEAHVDPDTGYVIDDSLTVQGAAADAKATGDAITELNSALMNSAKQLNISNKTDDYYIRKENGTLASGSGFSYSDMISIKGKKIYVKGVSHTYSDTNLLNFYKSHDYTAASFISIIPPISYSAVQVFTVPDGANYVAISYKTEDWGDLTISESLDDNGLLNNIDLAVFTSVNFNQWTDGEYVTLNGSILSDSGFSHTPLIPLTNTELYAFITVSNPSAIATIAYYSYDSNIGSFNFLGYERPATNVFTKLNIPDGAAYYVISGYKNNKSDIEIMYSGENIKQCENETSIRSIMSNLELINDHVGNIVNIKIIGDSITAGVGGTGYNDTESGGGDLIVSGRYENVTGYCWANLFKNFIEENYYCSVKNYGISGFDSANLVTFRSNLIQENDDIVIVCIGTNDRANASDSAWGGTKNVSKIKRSLNAIYTYCLYRNKKVIFVSPIPAINDSHITLARTASDIDHIFYQFAQEHNIEYVSMYKLMIQYLSDRQLDLNDYLDDGLHPNDSGYAMMFYLITNALGIGTTLENSLLPNE